ncbi:hypothetical protein T03_10348 [Trichinella britovi]|uniref:Uncharacterized protein n=1 Tax=Trichinella britovi TaxID=45882 RepID=A0A0V1ALH3_TRIBR|nr:hypothetical protein T03_10348 [Trichinella britovi]
MVSYIGFLPDKNNYGVPSALLTIDYWSRNSY